MMNRVKFEKTERVTVSNLLEAAHFWKKNEKLTLDSCVCLQATVEL